MYTVAILGVGARGADAYGNLINERKDKYKIVALCDLRKERLDRFGKLYGVSSENLFTDEDVFFQNKRADILLIATQDCDHFRHCIKAFKTGYDVLMEKPVTWKKSECEQLLKAQKKYGRKALVCHVLRYAPAFKKAAEILNSGKIGKLVAIDATERVGYWHQAHSYVRGNWRNTDKAAPMILAKCCHDLDLLQYYAGSRCKSISSVGDLTYFKKENAPTHSAARCIDCAVAKDCPYNAYNIYIKMWKEEGSPADFWPYSVIAPAPLTEEKLFDAIKTGPYGRCVFACDNNVVDHQLTVITFENGVKATLTMTGFTCLGGRRYVFHGTLGELILDETTDEITLMPYGKDVEKFNIKVLSEGGYGHGGGDSGLIDALGDMMSGNAPQTTSLETSIESHIMGICAEESRKKNGKLVFIR